MDIEKTTLKTEGIAITLSIEDAQTLINQIHKLGRDRYPHYIFTDIATLLNRADIYPEYDN